jgi:hypothetical protein
VGRGKRAEEMSRERMNECRGLRKEGRGQRAESRGNRAGCRGKRTERRE